MKKFKRVILWIVAKAKQFREALGPVPREAKW